VQRVLFLVPIVCLLALPASALAERATERYAPTQIFVAHDFLERARAAAGLNDYAEANIYARQAELDARIAWGMTDEPALRAQAEQILGEAAALAGKLTTSSQAPAAASYPSASVQAQALAPSPR